MPMSLCLPRFVSACYLLILSLPLLGQTALQEPVISEREFRFREVEQRALDLSKRLSEISGTEPVQLIDREQSLSPVRYESSAQRAFDVLPGPLEEIEPAIEEPEEESEPVVFASQVSRVTPTTQQRKGDYYIMPKIGLVFSSETKWNDVVDTFTLEGDIGNFVGGEIGRRWDNWMASIMVSYQYLDYEEISFINAATSDPTKLNGSEESYLISFNGGYSVPVTSRLSHGGVVGLGMAWRRNIVQRSFRRNILGVAEEVIEPAEVYSSLAFTYGLSLGFEYLFVNNFSGYCGYRLMGVSSNKSFEGAFQHLLELGVGANF
jgi:opacity protein-like surface antigen